MKRYVKASSKAESYLSESVKDEYARDIAQYHVGNYDQEGIGWLAKRYGLNLIEMLDVLDRAVELNYAVCKKSGVAYKVLGID